MTPVREALEKERSDLIAANEAATAWGAAVGVRCERIREIERELRSGKIDAGVAAPGEPCAWLRDLQPDAEDEALAVCIKGDPGAFPVYTTPQLAAGFGELPAIPDEDADFTPDLARKIIAKYQQIITSLRREAPAPAEGVAHTPAQFVDDVLSACDASNWDAELNTGDYFRGLRDAYERIHELAGEYQTSMYAWPRPSARPDTAEARYRIALEQITDFISGDDSALGAIARLIEVRKIAKSALSPPSGGDEATNISVSKEMALQMTSLPGDEAKESEGGCICQDQHRRGYCTEPGCPYAVRPSEPSPPADRREIVPPDVVRLVVAARRAFDRHNHPDDGTMRDLDAALEPFSATAKYDDEPDAT